MSLPSPIRLIPIVALACASCDAIPALTFAVDDGGQQDGVVADGANDGAPPDGGPPGDGGSTFPVVIALVGGVPAETGEANQTHLIYAANTGRWWVFWISANSTGMLSTSSSPDFRVWSAGPTLNLPTGQSHGNEGRNFSVDYANIAGNDVVHLTLALENSANNKKARYHARASLGVGGTVTFSTPTQISMVNDPALVDPDGTVTRIGTDHKVTDISGWAAYMGGGGTGNVSAWTSTTADTGTSGADTFGPQVDIAKSTSTVHSRALVALSGGKLLALWDTADQADPTNASFSSWSGTAWSVPGAVFGTSNPTSVNDWSACHVTDTDIHAVRRATSGAYDHVRYSTGWGPGGSIPADPGKTGSGVVLLSDGTHLALVTVSSDANNSVRTISWDGSAWGSWSTLAGSPASRGYLSGYVAPNGAGLIWTEPAPSGGFQIVGMPFTLQ